MGEFIINYPDQLKDLSSYFNNENSEFSMKRVELLLKGGYHEISYSEALKIVNRKSGTDFVFGYDFQVLFSDLFFTLINLLIFNILDIRGRKRSFYVNILVVLCLSEIFLVV